MRGNAGEENSYILKVLRLQDFLEPHAKGTVSRHRRRNVKRESQECRRDRVRQGRVKHHRRRLPGVGVHDVHERKHGYKHWSIFAFVQLRAVFARVRCVRVIHEFRYFLPIGNAVKGVRLIAVSNNELCALRIQFFNCLSPHTIDYIRERKERKKRNNTHAVIGLFNFLFVSKSLQRMVMYILDAKFKESKPTHAPLIESIGSIIICIYRWLGRDIYSKS